MSGAKFLDLNAPLPDELVPFKGKLGPNFNEVRRKVVSFAVEECIPMLPRYRQEFEELRQKQQDPLLTPQPPCFKELQQKRRTEDFGTFPLRRRRLEQPRVRPHAEILGAVPLVNAAMNCSAPDTGNMELSTSLVPLIRKGDF